MSNIKFFKTDTLLTASKSLAKSITKRLNQGDRVLWLISGGSTIPVAVQTASLLSEVAAGELIIALADERYGPRGHEASNWTQFLKESPPLTGFKTHPILEDKDPESTVEAYEKFLGTIFELNYYKIALLGIGADGHTAGILPLSPAVNSKRLVQLYDGADFRRVTITPKAISKLDEAVAFAQGTSKLDALNNLKSDLPISEQPAQALKLVPRVSVYSNLIGGVI